MRRVILHLLWVLLGASSLQAQNTYNILSLFPHHDKWKHYVMDVERGNIRPGGRLIVWEKNGGNNQLFYYDAATRTIRVGVNSGLVLDVAGTPNSQMGFVAGDVILWNYNGGNNQKWAIEAVPGESSFYLRNVQTGTYLVHQTSGSVGQAWKLHMGSRGGANSKWRLPDALGTSSGGSTATANFKKLRDVLPSPNAAGVYIISKSWFGKMHTLDVEGGNMREGGKLIVWQLDNNRPANQMFVMEGGVVRLINKSLYLSFNGNNEVVLTTNRARAANWAVEQNKTRGSFRLRDQGGRGYLAHKTKGDGLGGSGSWKCIVTNSSTDTHMEWTEGMPVNDSQVATMRSNGLAPAASGSPKPALLGNPPAAAIIANGGGNIIANGGGNVVANGGANIIANGGNNIIALGGGNIVALGGANIIAPGGGN
ncbi:RICIN domain-containing protein [Flaviaesturariibacter amylovorans]|uniref:Ricin B lectin domain-containing protein n=1 Tax=Flaviaesturariibacter amylovorans TaxID=1084520 RepID=A0ABP8HVH9_9BACT